MLVAGDGSVEGLASSETAKMERGTPAIFVKVRGQIVVATVRVSESSIEVWIESIGCGSLSSQSSIFVSSSLSRLLGFDGGGLVIPMLEVLLDGGFLRESIFVPHGS